MKRHYGVIIADCCPFEEVVLNYTTINDLFTATFKQTGRCRGNVNPHEVKCAFKGSDREFKTRCTNYEIEIDITTVNPEGFWDVCYISYQTRRVESTAIVIENAPEENTFAVR